MSFLHFTKNNTSPVYIVHSFEWLEDYQLGVMSLLVPLYCRLVYSMRNFLFKKKILLEQNFLNCRKKYTGPKIRRSRKQSDESALEIKKSSTKTILKKTTSYRTMQMKRTALHRFGAL
jgi:hypothetical protein